MKKALLLSALAVAALMSGTARAENDALVYNGALLPALSNQVVSFNTLKDAGSFYDTFSFSFTSLTGASVGAASGLQLQFNAASPNVDFTNIKLNGVVGTVDNTSGSGLVSVFFAGPVLGNVGNAPAYLLEVWGTATANATYGGSLNVSLVPEPESYALMLSGLGLVGWLARRRRA